VRVEPVCLLRLCRFDDRGHFQNTAQPELLKLVEDKVQGLLSTAP
jgi:hypothetical protein